MGTKLWGIWRRCHNILLWGLSFIEIEGANRCGGIVRTCTNQNGELARSESHRLWKFVSIGICSWRLICAATRHWSPFGDHRICNGLSLSSLGVLSLSLSLSLLLRKLGIDYFCSYRDNPISDCASKITLGFGGCKLRKCPFKYVLLLFIFS